MASDTSFNSSDEWLQFLESNQDRDGLRAFMAFTFEVGASGDVTMLDAILSNARPEQLGILLSTGMLRSTWRLSNHLPGWIPFRDRTGFIDTYVEDQVRKGNAWKFSEVQEAVSTEGQAMGIRKRRIKYLEDKIAAYTDELAKLKAIVDGK